MLVIQMVYILVSIEETKALKHWTVADKRSFSHAATVRCWMRTNLDIIIIVIIIIIKTPSVWRGCIYRTSGEAKQC